MGRRSFSCQAAAAAAVCCCCLALLVRPVHGGRSGTGLLGGAAFSSSRDYYRLPVPEPRFQVTQAQEEKEQPRGAATKARLWWSPAAPEAGLVRAELRSVPGGPDPLHHHGSPRRPEQERAAP